MIEAAALLSYWTIKEVGWSSNNEIESIAAEDGTSDL
jgi:hypothetical protein